MTMIEGTEISIELDRWYNTGWNSLHRDGRKSFRAMLLGVDERQLGHATGRDSFT
jgi:hypothetical protein